MPCTNCTPGSPTLDGALVPCCTYGPYESEVIVPGTGYSHDVGGSHDNSHG